MEVFFYIFRCVLIIKNLFRNINIFFKHNKMILLLSNQNIIKLVKRVIKFFIFIRYNKLTIISLESRKLNHRLRAFDLFSHVFFKKNYNDKQVYFDLFNIN